MLSLLNPTLNGHRYPDYEKLRELLGFDTHNREKAAHRKWVESCLENGDNYREDKWTGSIAVGSERFIGEIKTMMGGMAAGRRCMETWDSFELREA